MIAPLVLGQGWAGPLRSARAGSGPSGMGCAPCTCKKSSSIRRMYCFYSENYRVRIQMCNTPTEIKGKCAVYLASLEAWKLSQNPEATVSSHAQELYRGRAVKHACNRVPGQMSCFISKRGFVVSIPRVVVITLFLHPGHLQYPLKRCGAIFMSLVPHVSFPSTLHFAWIYVFVYLSVDLSIYLPTYRSYLSIYHLSIYLSVCLLI